MNIGRGSTCDAVRAALAVRVLRAVLAPVLLAGCAGSASQGPSPAELRAAEDERESVDTVLRRGRFELQCAEATAQVLERYEQGPATLIGVQGCGRQALYERRLRYSYRDRARTTRNTRWDRKP